MINKWKSWKRKGDFFMDKSRRNRSLQMSRRRKQQRRRRRIRYALRLTCCAAVLCLLLACAGKFGSICFRAIGQRWKTAPEENQTQEMQQEDYLETGNITGNYPPELLEMLEKNPETRDFVKNYTNRAKYINTEIDLSEEYTAGEVPLLLQWDKRWGYNSYGSELVGAAGCGPSCMSMAYIYLTGDTSMNPRRMAEFAEGNGYDTDQGTSWTFFTEGAALLGLSGEELPLSEGRIKEALNENGVVICSMRPGDFTTTGHFILIRGYDKKGFFVNDPNSRKNSEKQWDYETLESQIKCLWAILGK